MLKRIPLNLVHRNPDQPRKIFDQAELVDLANSIRNNGLMQPITVRPMGDGTYQIVAGERRYRAHCILDERGQLEGSSILAHVRKMDDIQRDLEAIIENLSRQDITALEQARAYQRMLDAGMTVEELATKLGLNQPWRITEKTRLLNLAPDLLKMYEKGHLGGEAAFEIAKIDDHADQTRIVQMINRGQLTGYKAVKAAVQAILEKLTQDDIFGAATAPAASQSDVDTINRMEAKIETVANMVAAGWKDGECQIARKVSPDRTRLMADKIKAMRSALLAMENQLRESAAQAELLAA